jgi:hypothetical protein
MDPRDDLESLAGGVACAACGETVPIDRIRLLARRDDIVFVEVTCPACRSDSLGIVIDETAAGPGGRILDLAGSGYGEFGPGDIERFRAARPIRASDVDVVRRLLAAGGLGALVGGTEPPPPGSPR